MMCTVVKDLKVKRSTTLILYLIPWCPDKGNFGRKNRKSPQSPHLLETVFLEVFSGSLALPPCSPLKMVMK